MIVSLFAELVITEACFLSLILPADYSQAQTNTVSSYYIYYHIINSNRP